MNSSEIQSHKTIMCPTLSQFSCIAFLGTPCLSTDSGVVHTNVSAHGEEKRATAVTWRWYFGTWSEGKVSTKPQNASLENG